MQCSAIDGEQKFENKIDATVNARRTLTLKYGETVDGVFCFFKWKYIKSVTLNGIVLKSVL